MPLKEKLADTKGSKKCIESTVLRLVRDTKIADEVKQL